MNGLFNINGGELLVILLVIALVVGPERLPKYTEQLTSVVRSARDYIKQARAKVDQEVSEHSGDIDWQSLDPRRYDPRRIVREALIEDTDSMRPGLATVAGAPAGAAAALRSQGTGQVGLAAGAPAPFDDEAT